MQSNHAQDSENYNKEQRTSQQGIKGSRLTESGKCDLIFSTNEIIYTGTQCIKLKLPSNKSNCPERQALNSDKATVNAIALQNANQP